MRSRHAWSPGSTRRRSTIAAAVAAATCLLLVACGSDSKTATASSSSSASGAPQPSGPPVKVLLIRDGEGTPVNIPQISDGAKAAQNAINKAGGVKGRPLQVDECNSKLDPNAAADCARQGTTGGYAAIVGTLTSNDSSIVPVAEGANVPLIGIIPTTQASYKSPDSFPISGGSSVRAIAMTKAVTSAGAKKVSILYIDVAAAAAFVPVLENGVKSNGATLGKSVGVSSCSPPQPTRSRWRKRSAAAEATTSTSRSPSRTRTT
jgi:hypothetical protein